MKNQELITVPTHLLAPVEAPQELAEKAEVIELPDHIKAAHVESTKAVPIEVIESLPGDIEVFHLPRLKLGANVIGRTIEVPGSTGTGTIESGTPLGPDREVETIGGIDDFPGGDPSRVIGYNGITKK